jgi:hypothetical protein
VLPAADFPLGLTLGSGAPEADIASAGTFLGVTRTEIGELQAVVAVLEKASTPLDPAGIRAVIGGAVRNLGEEGRKRGRPRPLPMALGLLQSRGEIRWVPVNGRIDQRRYGYVLWSPSPLSGAQSDLDTARAEVAKRYFGWAALASLKHFRWFSGLTVAAAEKPWSHWIYVRWTARTF